MKFWFLLIVAFVIIGNISCAKVVSNSNDSIIDDRTAYEIYLDSVWEADPDYFLDVIVETDEYQEYIANHEEWWKN